MMRETAGGRPGTPSNGEHTAAEGSEIDTASLGNSNVPFMGNTRLSVVTCNGWFNTLVSYTKWDMNGGHLSGYRIQM